MHYPALGNTANKWILPIHDSKAALNRDRSIYGGSSLFVDFENRRAAGFTPLISSLETVGYA